MHAISLLVYTGNWACL